MTEAPIHIEWPIWLRRMGIFGTIALLSWISTACGDIATASSSEVDCNSANLISISQETDEIREINEANVVELVVPDCPRVVYMDLLDQELERRLSTSIPDNLKIGRNVFPVPKVDLAKGVRYLPIKDLPSKYEVVVIKDQALVVVPITVEGTTAEGVYYQGESVLVLQDFLNALNASLQAGEMRDDVRLAAGYSTDPAKDLKRGNIDALVFAIGTATVVVGGILGALYFGSNNEYGVSTKQVGKKLNQRIKKSLSESSSDPYYYYADVQPDSGAQKNDTPFKVGDRVTVKGSINWGQVDHARKIALSSGATIENVLNQVGFTNSQFETDLRNAVEKARELDSRYKELQNSSGDIPVALDIDAIRALSIDLNDSYSSPPPTVESLVQLRAAQQIEREFGEAAREVQERSEAARAAGQKTMDHIAYISSERSQLGRTGANLGEFDHIIQEDYKHIDRVANSIPPDSVKDVE